MIAFNIVTGVIWLLVAGFSLFSYIAAVKANEQDAATRALVSVFGALILAVLMVDRLV